MSLTPKPEIVYVFDGYCGWCWGMAEVISRLGHEFSDRFDFSAVCGGLMLGTRIGPLGDFADYIERAIPRVEQMTGAIFSEAHRQLIKRRDTIQDSTMPAMAFTLVVAAKPETNTLALAHALLELNFRQGKVLSDAESYRDLFANFGLPSSAIDDLRGRRAILTAEAQFERAREIGAESFPTLVYGREGQYFPLCQGYQNYENLAHALDVLHREPPPL
jgi:putative protein-disulfide isomerase